MAQKTKKGLFVFIFTVLLLPLVQQQFPVISSGVLKGYYTNSPDDTFTWNKWFDGSYQSAKDHFINDHIGFRPDMLRLTGQIDFSFFRKVDYGGIVVGTDNYLYFSEYIDAYYGKDFAGYNELTNRMVKLKAVQDTLTKLGKTLLLVYEPCKAWYYAEHIPGNSRPHGQFSNNYIVSEHLGDSLGIHQIDFNKWFLGMKDTTHELLYSRLGIHWTKYGSILGADSLVRYIDRVRHIHMPYPVWDRAEHTTRAQAPDNDLADIANLIFPMSVDTFCYPELKFVEDSTTTKPNAMYVGDSYIVNLLRTNIMEHIHSKWEFLFYFRDVQDNTNCSTDSYISIANYDWKQKLNEADCVILMFTPMNFRSVSGGLKEFIEAAYDYYYPKK